MSALVNYCIGVRGLVYPGLQAQDDAAAAEATQVQEALANRAEWRLAPVLEHQSGYYILGLRPDEDSAERIARQGSTGP